MEEREAIYRMTCISKMTIGQYDSLIGLYGSAAAAWAKDNVLLPPEVLTEWKKEHEAEWQEARAAEYEYLEESGVRFLIRSDPEFPTCLLSLPDPPMGIFLKGKLPGEEDERVAVIGARKCTPYGKACASKLAADLAGQGIWVVSGMALGIDAWAQWSALDAGGPSLAVLGCGIDICYPSSHRRLYEILEERGGIISEYPPGVPAMAYHFPRRNRIISAMSHVVVVVEARKKSGTLITVDRALEQGRDVLAFPGRVDDVLSEGTLGLLRQGAGICLGAEDVYYALGWPEERIRKVCGANGDMRKISAKLTENEAKIYTALAVTPIHIDRIMDLTGIPMGQLMVDLWSLESKKMCRQTASGMYRRT